MTAESTGKTTHYGEPGINPRPVVKQEQQQQSMRTYTAEQDSKQENATSRRIIVLEGDLGETRAGKVRRHDRVVHYTQPSGLSTVMT
jgi:hypothetical protein